MSGVGWFRWFVLAAALFVLTLVLALIRNCMRYRRRRLLTPNKILIAGTMFSAAVMFMPMYLERTAGPNLILQCIKVFFLSLHHAVRLFTIEGDFMEFFNFETNGITSMTPLIQTHFTCLGLFFYCWAPLLTVHTLLSFAKNFRSHRKYILGVCRETHVFSELNEKSLALAQSIEKKHHEGNGKKRRFRFHIRGPLLVFTDVSYKDNEANLDLVEQAKELGAILFTRDLESIRYKLRFTRRKVNIYLISEDEREKVRHTSRIIATYRQDKKVALYVFSNTPESKCFLKSYTQDEKKEMKLRVIRVNDIRSLIYHDLYENGLRLFENASTLADGTREVSVAIAGLGQYGMEMMKALLWYCQIPGYRVKITAIDEQEKVESRISALCPGLVREKPNDTPGDMRYTLRVREAKFGTEEFFTQLEDDETGKLSYVFVCLGDDRQNLSAALDIRARLARKSSFPYIETIVYDSALKERLNSDVQAKNIRIIGDLASFYSVDTVIDSKLVDAGLEVHRRWQDESPKKGSTYNEFYMDDYGFFSSLASALHRTLRKKIIGYERDLAPAKDAAERARTVFPFYYDPRKDRARPYTDPMRRSWRALLPCLNENESVKALSNEMKLYKRILYAHMAREQYEKLTNSQRIQVLTLAQKWMNEQTIDALRKRMKKAKLSIDEDFFANLTEKAKKGVGIAGALGCYEYLRSDAFHKYVKSRLTDKHCKVLEAWRASLMEIPMLGDKGKYLSGYDDLINVPMPKDPDALSEKEKKCLRDNWNRRYDMGVQMFEIIAEVMTAGEKDVEKKREAIRKMEDETWMSDRSPLLDTVWKVFCENRKLILGGNACPEGSSVERALIGKTSGAPNYGNDCFLLGLSFSYIEHVRWNAYMRSEGFSYHPTTDKGYNLHRDIVPVDQLRFSDIIKDI